MHYFTRRNGELYVDEVSLERLASTYGTPLYVYSGQTVRHHYERLAEAFAPVGAEIHYAVKACSNLAVLKLLHSLGAGFDVVSAGEIERCLRIGADPTRIAFAGVGKTRSEMRFALERNVGLFNVESRAELESLAAEAAQLGVVAPVALRVNPDVAAETHAYISTGKRENKFGLSFDHALSAVSWVQSQPSLRLRGLHVHIGSQIREPGPFVGAVERVLGFARQLEQSGTKIELLDLGGGFAAEYDEPAPLVSQIAAAVTPLLEGVQSQVLLEPGRFIMANAGVLVCEVISVKPGDAKTFVIADAAMNDLLRPALYQAHHRIELVTARAGETQRVDVVGPVCETGDFLGLDRELPVGVSAGDRLAVMGAGAYGFVMASNYNSRPRPAEVLVDGDRVVHARRRETVDDLLALEFPDGDELPAN